MRNFYEFLGVAETATEAEITSAFRRWRRLVDPDKVPPAVKDQAETLAKLMESAYSTLKDDVKRAAYDLELKRWKESQLPPSSATPPPAPSPVRGPSFFGDMAGAVWKTVTETATEAAQDAAADAIAKVADKLRKKKGTK